MCQFVSLGLLWDLFLLIKCLFMVVSQMFITVCGNSAFFILWSFLCLFDNCSVVCY